MFAHPRLMECGGGKKNVIANAAVSYTAITFETTDIRLNLGVLFGFLEHSELWKVQGEFKFLTAKYINVLHFEYTRREQ